MQKPLDNLLDELKALDSELVPVDGSLLKPSQCYHFETDPVHLLFNTNCPDDLRQKINAIVQKHIPENESSTPE